MWTRIPNDNYRSKIFKGCIQAIINDPVIRKGLYTDLPYPGNFLHLCPMKGSSTYLTKYVNSSVDLQTTTGVLPAKCMFASASCKMRRCWETSLQFSVEQIVEDELKIGTTFISEIPAGGWKILVTLWDKWGKFRDVFHSENVNISEEQLF